MQSVKMPNIVGAYLESLIKKVDECVSNQEDYSTTKIGEGIPYGYSLSTIWGLIIYKMSVVYIVGKIVWKIFVLL